MRVFYTEKNSIFYYRIIVQYILSQNLKQADFLYDFFFLNKKHQKWAQNLWGY